MWFEGALGLKFLTSKNAISNRLSQKPLAQTSRHAPSSVEVDLRQRISPVIGWWAGSTVTSEHTSVRRVVRSLGPHCGEL